MDSWDARYGCGRYGIPPIAGYWCATLVVLTGWDSRQMAGDKPSGRVLAPRGLGLLGDGFHLRLALDGFDPLRRFLRQLRQALLESGHQVDNRRHLLGFLDGRNLFAF